MPFHLADLLVLVIFDRNGLVVLLLGLEVLGAIGIEACQNLLQGGDDVFIQADHLSRGVFEPLLDVIDF